MRQVRTLLLLSLLGCTGTAGPRSGGGSDAGPLGPSVADFVGLNAFIDDPTALLSPVGNVRERHDWAWCEGNGDAGYPGYPKNQDAFTRFNGAWDWDAFYGQLRDGGVFGYPALQGGVPWLNAGALPPVPAGATPTDPASYVAHADVMFQFSARYGRVRVADAKLKLAADQRRVSGLGLLDYVEDFNEEDADRSLKGGGPLFSPDAYAAMASADYDGDQGRLGDTLGVKNADPAMKLVMGGLAGVPGDPPAWEASIEAYLEGVRSWAQAHRGGSFPADVINVHHYDFAPDAFGAADPAPARSPEAAGLTATMTPLRQYRDAHLPGRELWITEFGYDTDPQSSLRAPAIGGSTPGLVQGQWLVRSYFALLEAGFDRAFLFASRDGCSGADCHAQFATSGIAGVKGDWAPKPAWYFIATLRARLGPFHFVGPVNIGHPELKVELLKDPVRGMTAWVLWSPTSTGTSVPGVVLEVGSRAEVTEVRLVDQQPTGLERAPAVVAGKVTLEVDETPVLIIGTD